MTHRTEKERKKRLAAEAKAAASAQRKADKEQVDKAKKETAAIASFNNKMQSLATFVISSLNPLEKEFDNKLKFCNLKWSPYHLQEICVVYVLIN